MYKTYCRTSNTSRKEDHWRYTHEGSDICFLSVLWTEQSSGWGRRNGTDKGTLYLTFESGKAYLVIVPFNSKDKVPIKLSLSDKEEVTAKKVELIYSFLRYINNKVTIKHRLEKVWEKLKNHCFFPISEDLIKSITTILDQCFYAAFPYWGKEVHVYSLSTINTAFPEFEKKELPQILSEKIKEKCFRRFFYEKNKAENKYSSLINLRNFCSDLNAAKGFDVNHIYSIVTNQEGYAFSGLSRLPDFLNLYKKNPKYVMGLIAKAEYKIGYDLRDCITMIISMHKEFGEVTYYPKWEKTESLKEFHDKIVMYYNRFKNKPKAILVNDYCKLLKEEPVVPETGHNIIIPDTDADLKDWGVIMRNCIGGYRPTNEKSLIAISDKNGKMVYNLEINHYDSLSFRQFYGPCNQHVPEKEKEPIVKYLEKKWKQHKKLLQAVNTSATTSPLEAARL